MSGADTIETLRHAAHVLRGQGLVGPGEPVESVLLPGGSVGVIVQVTASDGRSWAVKTTPGLPPEVLDDEADGLRALGAIGSVAVPGIHHQGEGVLVLDALHGCEHEPPRFWEHLAGDIADLHRRTSQQRHGWAVDNWLGLLPQHNRWDTDGHRFFAERRLLRFLPEPKLAAALDPADRAAVERLADRLPELVPPMPAVLLHGDLWLGNLLSGGGRPTLIDPAVCYGWAEIDIGLLYLLPRPPASARFFDVWQELAGPQPGWQDRAKLLIIRELMSVVAQRGEQDATAANLRGLLAPFRPRPRGGGAAATVTP